MREEKAYLANPAKEEDLVYLDTVWDKNIPHVNIGTEESPYYLPQEMFKITDEQRNMLTHHFKTKY